jgi:hypothetical protein
MECLLLPTDVLNYTYAEIKYRYFILILDV